MRERAATFYVHLPFAVVVALPIFAYTVRQSEHNCILRRRRRRRRREFRAVAVVKYFDHKNLYEREKDMLNQSNKYCTHPIHHHRAYCRLRTTVTHFHTDTA